MSKIQFATTEQISAMIELTRHFDGDCKAFRRAITLLGIGDKTAFHYWDLEKLSV